MYNFKPFNVEHFFIFLVKTKIANEKKKFDHAKKYQKKAKKNLVLISAFFRF